MDNSTWVGNLVPSKASIVVINSNSSVSIGVSSSCMIAQLTVSGPVNFTITNASFIVSGAISSYSNSAVTVFGGALKAESLNFGSAYFTESVITINQTANVDFISMVNSTIAASAFSSQSVVTKEYCTFTNGNFSVQNGSFPDALALYFASLFSTSKLEIGYFDVQQSNVHSDLSATQMLVTDNVTILGNMEISGPNNSVAIYSNTSYLEVVGSYSQEGGSIAAEKGPVEAPSITASELIINDVEIYVLALFRFRRDEKLLFAKAEVINATFSDVQMQVLLDENSYIRNLGFEVEAIIEEDEIYLMSKKETYLQENWPWMALLGGMGLSWIVMVWRLNKFVPQLTEKMGDPPETIKRYAKKVKVSKLGCCSCCLFICWGIILFPMMIEVSVITMALAVFIPIGFIYGLLEHKFVMAWAFVTLFSQMGGILDLFADIMLLCKFFIYEYSDDLSGYTPEELKEANELEKNLLWARFGVTMGGACLSLFLLVALRGSFGGILDNMTGENVWEDEEKRKTHCCKKCCTLCGAVFALPFVLVVACALWKVLLIAVRILLLFHVARSLFKHRVVEEKVEKMVMWMECFFYLDLMWNGIPLGILTGLELFHYKERLVFDPATTFEILKLGALGVELISASFLFYFSICGLINKVPFLHHEHHHTSHERQGLLHGRLDGEDYHRTVNM
eukprot:Phypoly_transcript_04290.p1 GENE.Phypoly_transcript_04290~~Phypoly_transcript_04290.p1  ORF type:complete len:723 (+),score=96.49 Phypoly_transcript_04290:130-2169(+)